MADNSAPSAQKYVVNLEPLTGSLGKYTLDPKWWGMIPASLWSNEPHMHTQIEILFAVAGEGEALIAGRQTGIRRGDVMVAFPGEIHSLSTRHGSLLEVHFLAFDMSLLASNGVKSPATNEETELDRLIRIFLDAQDRIKAEGAAAAVGTTMSVIREALLSKKPGWNEAVSDLCRACFIETAWLFTGDAVKQSAIHPEGTWETTGGDLSPFPENLFKRAENFIFNRFRDSLTVEDVANHLGISVRTLKRLFSQHGMNFRMYSNTIRLGIARYMLMSTDRPIKAIAREMGYSGQARFTSMFQRVFGVSPAGYRRMARRKA